MIALILAASLFLLLASSFFLSSSSLSRFLSRFQLFNFNIPPPPVLLPDELIVEILSFLSVKTITQLRCVSKSWNSLISDPAFIKMHFKKSSQNPHLITSKRRSRMSGFVSIPLHRLVENQSMTVAGDTYHNLKYDICRIVGSCNGLICLLFKSYSFTLTKYRFCFWNPAMGTISAELGVFHANYKPISHLFKFTFGCDYLSGTYKVVALRQERNKEQQNGNSWRSRVRVYSLSDKCWRNIGSFPTVPLRWNHGVHLSGTVNWLTIHGDFILNTVGEILKIPISHVQQFVIVSLDLSTEKYARILLPKGFNEVPCVEPSLRVMTDCLFFSHDFKRTELVIWQMREFGVQESWTQLFRIEYDNLQIHNLQIDDDFVGFMKSEIPLLPLYLSMNGDTLILTIDEDVEGVIIYNHRDMRVERISISNNVCWFSAIDYVESLVSTPWNSGDIEELEEEEEEHFL